VIGITKWALLSLHRIFLFTGILDGLPVNVGAKQRFDDLYLESNG
jgi:hypothetical protein